MSIPKYSLLFLYLHGSTLAPLLSTSFPFDYHVRISSILNTTEINDHMPTTSDSGGVIVMQGGDISDEILFCWVCCRAEANHDGVKLYVASCGHVLCQEHIVQGNNHVFLMLAYIALKDNIHGRTCGFCDMNGVDTVPTTQVGSFFLLGRYSVLH